MIVPTDDLSRQALEAQAQDLALEDTIVALDKAFLVGIQGFTLEAYLKQVRPLHHQSVRLALGWRLAPSLPLAPGWLRAWS